MRMHAAERLLFRENISNNLSAKVYTLEIYGIYAMDFYTEMQTFSWYDIIAFKDFLILETGVIKVKAHNYLRDKAVANLVIIILLYNQPMVQGRKII